jgi:acyl-CoA thioester hydrolase
MSTSSSDPTAFLDGLIAGYQGVAQSWECDLMGHLNVSFYFGRSSDQAFFTRHALAMSPSQMRAQNIGTVALEEHVRFHREVASGGTMIGRSAPTEIGEKTMTIHQEFRDSEANLFCTFKTRIGHFDTAARRLVPWREATLEAAHKYQITQPDFSAPKFLSGNGRVPAITREQTQAEGFVRCGGAGVNSWECDQFGHMNTMFYARRLTEAAPHMWRAMGHDLLDGMRQGLGSVVGEICLSYLAEVREGDILETYSSIREVNEKTVLIEHRLFNAETGELSALARLRVVHFNLTTRRAQKWPDDMRQTIETNLVPLDVAKN